MSTDVSLSGGRGRRWIDTSEYSAQLRELLVDPETRSIKLTLFDQSKQSQDLSEPPVCNGRARIHHFRSDEGADWPSNPLPMVPARFALNLPTAKEIDALVFQSSGCNWRCWYCYVPFEDLTGRRGSLTSVAEMVDAFEQLSPRPEMIDLSGGQPDLTPEWTVWFLEELDRRHIDDVYLWSDDNLSTDYLWRYLTDRELAKLGEHPRYGRACCLKGHNSKAFSFNTKAHPDLFDYQFQLLHRLQDSTQIDYYLYMTFTATDVSGLSADMRKLVDRLQSISETLPLRSVPLKVLAWGPVEPRLDQERVASMSIQSEIVNAWRSELECRFTTRELQTPISLIPRG